MKSRRKKKAVAIAMSSILAISMLSACSSSSKKEESASTASPSGSPAASQAPSPASITIFGNNGNQETFPQGSNPEKLKEIQSILAKETGVTATVNLAPKGKAAIDKLNVMLASNDNFDLFFGRWTQYAGRGAIQPINAALDKYGANIKKAIPEQMWKEVTDSKGNIWGIPKESPSNSFPVWIRNDWLTKLNLAEPKTIEDLEKIMQAFKEKDPDGDGKDDTIVMALDMSAKGINQIKYVWGGAYMEQGGANWLDSKDNKVKPPEMNPQYKDVLGKLNEWFSKGYIYKESFGTINPEELFKTNRVGIWAGWYSRATLIAAPKANIDYTPYWLSGPKGKMETITPYSDNAFLIPKTSKNADAVIRFLDWQFQSPDHFLTVSRGVKDQDWKWVDEKNLTYEYLVKDVAAGYIGEFVWSHVANWENKLVSVDPTSKKHNEFLKNQYYSNLKENGKMPVDMDVIYNQGDINNAVPTIGDITRLNTEEPIKFIIGARPLSDWDKFQEELKKAGVDKLVDELTKQYNNSKK